ncbi:MAG TPA: TonB-dependent receptor, partial [Bacteroidota bacterium]|nr:TonB-dependent receptor [Bacteroidota bacterium]
MIRYFIPLLFAIACLQSSVAIAQTSIYGYVRDASTQERLVGASILIEGSTRGTTTNTFGFFSLPVGNSRAIVLRVSYLGYEPKVMSWQDSVSGAAPVMISLRTTGIQSPEVLIEARRNATPVISTSMGISSIAIQEVHTLPSVGGEVDLVKAVQLQSGVSSGQEWSNGLYVRGGGFDQNLILLDGVTIYNPNHLFGFFSIFNTDAVKNVELMKGGIPAEYGGRLSSVLSFTLNEGNREQMVWKGGISMIASRLSVEGPLSEDKSGSFLLSARRSYFDTFLWALNGFNGGSPDFYIYDLTAKANYSVSPDDRLMVSGYFGKDNLKHSSGPNDMDIFSIDLSWGNQAYAFRWNHLWSPSIFSNLALIYSDYASDQKSNVFNTVSGKEPSVRDVTMKVDGEYYCTERHTFRFGGEYIFHRFRATAGLFQGNDDAVTLNASEVQSYVSHEWSVADRLHVTEGIRCDYFSTARRAEIDPRMNVRLLISDDLSVKASYTRMHQFVHL